MIDDGYSTTKSGFWDTFFEPKKSSSIYIESSPQIPSFKVISSELISPNTVFAVDWSPANSYSTTGIIGFTFSNETFKWDKILSKSGRWKEKASSLKKELGASEYIKARLLMKRTLPNNLEQSVESWAKTIRIFSLSSKEQIVEFLIDTSENIREVAKTRIKQLENNKNRTSPNG